MRRRSTSHSPAAAASSSGCRSCAAATAVRYEREGFADATSPGARSRRDRACGDSARRNRRVRRRRAASRSRGRRSAAPMPPASPMGRALSPNGTSPPAPTSSWKTPIPGLATSSPIVWGDRVIVVTAASDEDTSFRTGLYGDVKPVDNLPVHSYRVYALDRATGKIVWQREAFSGAPQTKRHTKSSHANATPVDRRPPHRRGVRIDRPDGLLLDGRHAASGRRTSACSTAAGSSIPAISGATPARRSSTSRR